MQSAATGSMVERMVGAARLDAHTYEEVERDTGATGQAALVVVLAAIAAGIGAIGQDGGIGFIAGIIYGLIGWAVFAGFVYFIGTRLLAGAATSATWGELLRTLGFARTVSLLAVFGFIPLLGWVAVLVAFFWYLAAAAVAIRQALEISTGRAIAVGVVALILQLIVTAIIAAIFGVGV